MPCEVRVTSMTHPLSGRLLAASGFTRRGGVVFLLVTLPDGSPGTLPADATGILNGASQRPGTAVLSADGLLRLHELVTALTPAAQSRSRRRTRK